MLKGKGRTILLVEDEAILAMNEKMQLEKYGYAVRTVSCGEKAIEAVETSSDVELILMDINLGPGIDGTEAAERILKKHDIPVVFVSSHTEPEIVEKTEKISSYGYVVKNSSITVLDASIKMAFKLFEAKKKELAKERALMLSEEKYRLISENTSDGIVHFSSAGLIDYASPSYLKQLGYSKLKELGKGYEAISQEIHPDDRDALLSALNQAIENKMEELTYTFRVRHADGHYLWREDHSSFLYDKGGAYLGAYVSCRDITDRKSIENRLIVLGKAIESSPVVIIVSDVNGAIEYVNPRFTIVTGYSREEILGKNLRFLKSGKTDESVYKDLWNTLNAGNEWKGYFRNRRKNGELYYESATIAPVRNHKGETTNYIAIKEDVTEKRYIQESLEESNVRFNTLAGSQSVLIWEAGADKLCTYFNPTWLAFTGRSMEEELGDGWAEGVHPDDLERCLKTYTEAFDARREFSMEYRLRKADGEYGWLIDHGSPKYHDQEFLGYIGSCVDITKSKSYENILRESEEKYRLLYEYAGVGIGYYDPEGVVLSYNQLAARYMGGAPEAYIGKSLYELYPKPDADMYLSRIKTAASSDKPVAYEDIVTLPAGDKTFLSTFTRILDLEGKLLGVQIISQDISDSKRNEEDLRESKLKAEMLLNISAEIIMAVDFDGVISLLNESGHVKLGYESPELIGKNWFDICLPAEGREGLRAYFKSLRNNTPLSIDTHENEVITKSKERRAILWHNSILKDKEGRGIGLFSSGEDITERKNAEAALKESRERLRFALDVSGLGEWEYSLKENKVYRSARWAEMLGFTQQEIGDSFEQGINLQHPDDRELVKKAVRDYHEGRTDEFKVEYRMLTKSGGYKWIQDCGKTLEWDEEGKPIRFCGTHADIDERKRAEYLLEQDKKRLQNVLSGMNAGTWEWNVQTRKADIDEASAALLGYTLEELGPDLFQSWMDLKHPDDVAESNRLLMEHARGETEYYAFESRMKHKNGNWVWILGRGKAAEWDGAGKPLRIFGTHIDVSEQKYYELALKESQERLHFALEGSNLGEWDWNLKTGRIKRNERWWEMLGYSSSEMNDDLQQGIDLQHPDDHEGIWKFVQDHLEGRTDHYSVEYRLKTKSGGYKWIHDCGKIMERDAEGKPLRLCGTHADIDEQKKAAEKIKALLAEKELILKEVHHRIKNSMNTISGLLSFHADVSKESPAALFCRTPRIEFRACRSCMTACIVRPIILSFPYANTCRL
jgi:PAS domain S-box-containing protein